MYNDERRNLLSTIKNIDCDEVWRLWWGVTEIVLIKTLFFWNCSADAHTEAQILNATIEYILTTKWFEK